MQNIMKGSSAVVLETLRNASAEEVTAADSFVEQVVCSVHASCAAKAHIAAVLPGRVATTYVYLQRLSAPACPGECSDCEGMVITYDRMEIYLCFLVLSMDRAFIVRNIRLIF